MHDDELKNNNYPKGNLFDSDSDADSGESADEFEDFFNNSDDEAPNNPYIAGGGGIHRDMQKNSKNLSKKETEKLKKLTPSAGAKFRGKGKNKHDIKKKGEADPYSYVKIGSGINNKRKRRQISKNFKKEIKVLFKTSKGGKAGGKMD